MRCGPHARESRARYNTHGWSATLTRGVCGPTSSAGDRVTWPPGRSGTQRAARAVLSREPRTRHQSETNRETGPTDRTVSPRKRVWCFLPPSLSLSDSFSPLSLPSSYSFPELLSPLFHPSFSPRYLGWRARAIHHVSGSCVPPPRRIYHPTFSRVTCYTPQCCVFTRRRVPP